MVLLGHLSRHKFPKYISNKPTTSPTPSYEIQTHQHQHPLSPQPAPLKTINLNPKPPIQTKYHTLPSPHTTSKQPIHQTKPYHYSHPTHPFRPPKSQIEPQPAFPCNNFNIKVISKRYHQTPLKPQFYTLFPINSSRPQSPQLQNHPQKPENIYILNKNLTSQGVHITNHPLYTYKNPQKHTYPPPIVTKL